MSFTVIYIKEQQSPKSDKEYKEQKKILFYLSMIQS